MRSTRCWPRSPRSPGCGTSRRSAARRGDSATSACGSNGPSSCSASRGSLRAASIATCHRRRVGDGRRRRVGGPAGVEREPRRLPPSAPQRRRRGAGAGAAAARSRQPAWLRHVHGSSRRARRRRRLVRRDRDRQPSRRHRDGRVRRRSRVAPSIWRRSPRRSRRSPTRSSTRWFATPVKPMLMHAGRARAARRDRPALPRLAPDDVRVLAADDRRLHARRRDAAADAAADRRARRRGGRAGAGRARRAQRRVRQPCAAARHPPPARPAHRRRRRRDVTVQPIVVDGAGPPWEDVAASVGELRGAEALDVRPFAGGVPLRVRRRRTWPICARSPRPAFAPGRPIVEAARELVPRDPRAVRVRPRVHRGVDAAGGRARRRGAACARTSPTSPSARCGCSASPPAT